MLHNNFDTFSDEKLVTLMKSGNQVAFNQLYNRYWKVLFSKTINILKDKSLSEDVLQDVFTSIWLRRELLEINDIKSYLFAAARNNALLKIRNEKFVELNADTIAGLTLIPEAEISSNENDLLLNIENEIQKLPKRCQTIFYLSRFEHYSIVEIAALLKISHRSVENQLHLALKHLRKNFAMSRFLSIFF